jgi:hypothetical protein
MQWQLLKLSKLMLSFGVGDRKFNTDTFVFYRLKFHKNHYAKNYETRTNDIAKKYCYTPAMFVALALKQRET